MIFLHCSTRIKHVLCLIYRLRSHSINTEVKNAIVILFYVKYWREDITEQWSIAVRRIGKPRIRWEDDVSTDLGEMKIQNLSKMAVDRKEWKRIVEQAKTHKEL
jgi:hypothetical protein